MKSIIDNIQIFKDYFTGKLSIDEVEQYLEAYNFQPEDFEKDLQNTPINADERTINAIVDLLLQLNINFTLWPAYFQQELSLYALLKEIAKDHEHSIQLNQLLDLLLKKRLEAFFALAINIGLFTLTILPLIAYSILQWQWLFHFLFDTANILPILGVFFSIGLLATNLYLNHLNDRRPAYKIYRDDAFILTNSLLNITGKIVLILTPFTYPIAASVLFLLATVIELIKESWYLYELDFDYQQKEFLDNTQSIILHQQFARIEHDYYKQRNKLIINLLGAILLLGVLIACHFVPFGLTLTLLTTASIGIIYLIKLAALKINDHISNDNLQSELKAISELHDKVMVDKGTVNQFVQSIQVPQLSDSDNLSHPQKIRGLDRSNLVFFKEANNSSFLEQPHHTLTASV